MRLLDVAETAVMSQQEQEWPFRLEMWDKQATRVEEVIAFVADRDVARAALQKPSADDPARPLSFVRSARGQPKSVKMLNFIEGAQEVGRWSADEQLVRSRARTGPGPHHVLRSSYPLVD